jgi:hypothetical protein
MINLIYGIIFYFLHIQEEYSGKSGNPVKQGGMMSFRQVISLDKQTKKGVIAMKTWKLGAMLFLCAVVLIASAWAEEGITGIWQGTDAQTGAIMRLTLRDDGTFEGFKTDGQEVYDGMYQASDGVCSLIGKDQTSLADFKFIHSGGSLVLLAEKGMVYTFEKQEGSLLDEALFGTWGGLDNGMYGEITFEPTGEARAFIPYRDEGALKAAYETAGGKLILRDGDGNASILAYQVAEDGLTLTYPDGDIVAMSRKDGYLERAAQAAGTVSGAADKTLCGTWGFYNDGVYREITFSGDGSFSSIIPQDGDITVTGQYIAWNGTVVILADGQLLVDTYQVVDNELWYTPALHTKQVYTKKSGPLARTTVQE